MPIGERGQPLETCVTEHRVHPLTPLARRRAGERAVQRIHLGEQTDILRRVAPCKGSGRRPAAVFDDAITAELGDGAGDLGTGESRHLGQVTGAAGPCPSACSACSETASASPSSRPGRRCGRSG